jgi:hypothetical protein
MRWQNFGWLHNRDTLPLAFTENRRHDWDVRVAVKVIEDQLVKSERLSTKAKDSVSQNNLA